MRKPVVSVYTAEELRDLQAIQLKRYDWDFSREREFIENIFCTRVNFLLIAYSLFVTAGAASVQSRVLFAAIMFAGAALCLMVGLTVMRAYAKLDVLFRILYGALPEHAISIVDQETKRSGRRLFRVNPIIAYLLPTFTVVTLLAGGLAKLLSWF